MKSDVVAGGVMLAVMMFGYAIMDLTVYSHIGVPTWLRHAGIVAESLLGIMFLTVAVLEVFGIRPPAVSNN